MEILGFRNVAGRMRLTIVFIMMACSALFTPRAIAQNTVTYTYKYTGNPFNLALCNSVHAPAQNLTCIGAGNVTVLLTIDAGLHPTSITASAPGLTLTYPAPNTILDVGTLLFTKQPANGGVPSSVFIVISDPSQTQEIFIGGTFDLVETLDGFNNVPANAAGDSYYPGTWSLVSVQTGGTPLQITTTSLPNASSGTPYSTMIEATGGSGTGYTWSVSSGSLPPGFTFSSEGSCGAGCVDVVLSSTGSPIAPATSYSFTVEVTDSAGNAATPQPLTLAVSCPLNFTVSPYSGAPYSLDGAPTSMNATFTPTTTNGLPMGLAAAEMACGFTGFNWQQQITSLSASLFVPNTPYPPAVSLQNIAPNGTLVAPPSFYDPPQGGYQNEPSTAFSFPFFWSSTELNRLIPCTKDSAVETGNQLRFQDCPANPIYWPLAAPPTSFTTSLVGVLPSGLPSARLFTWTWQSDFGGYVIGGSPPGLGGVWQTKSISPIDPSSGTGGVTITSINGVPLATLNSGSTCNGVYGGTFNGNVTVSTGQTCNFLSGNITGNVQQNGGNLVLAGGVIVGGNVQINGGGTFSIDPATIDGDLQIQNIPAGTAQNQVCGTTVNGDLQFQNNGTAVQIGSASPSCAGNTIGGNLTVQNNTAAATVIGNTVGGNLTVQNNTAATIVNGNTVTGNLQDQNNTASTQVFTDTVGGNLHCQQNSTITGGSDTAKSLQGQCAGF
jgi:hypothetical protein